MRKTKSREKLEALADKGKAHKEDVELATQFIDYYTASQQLKAGSVAKYTYCLKAFVQQLFDMGTSCSSLKEKDVLALLDWLKQSKWSEDTRECYWDRFTRFWTWSADRAEEEGNSWDARAYRLIADPRRKITYKVDKNKKGHKGTLTEEEVLKLLDVEKNLRYKAFFSVLYESGMRSGEALTLRIQDVQQSDNGTYILNIRESKTEKRPVPIMNGACNYLRQWLSFHPEKDNRDAFLFLNVNNEPLENPASNYQLKRLLKRAGIKKKKITLHSFRHSRATHLASKGLSEFQLCRLFGWKMGSKMPATYIRQGAVDVTKALKKASGIPVEEDEKKEAGKRCFQCNHLNSEESEYCDICSLPLSEEKLAIIKGNAQTFGKKDLLEQFHAQKQALKELIKETMREDIEAIKQTIKENIK